MTDIANYLENAWANSVRGGGAGTNFTAPAALYVKLHIADPTEDGTGGAAANTTRDEIQFGAAANGVITNTNLVEWTSVPNTETYSHVSIWDNSTAGNCLFVADLTAPKAVTTGDTFQLPSSSVSITLS